MRLGKHRFHPGTILLQKNSRPVRQVVDITTQDASFGGETTAKLLRLFFEEPAIEHGHGFVLPGAQRTLVTPCRWFRVWQLHAPPPPGPVSPSGPVPVAPGLATKLLRNNDRIHRPFSASYCYAVRKGSTRRGGTMELGRLPRIVTVHGSTENKPLKNANRR